ncbi:MAG: alpha-amylase family glycosyl hydrolase [Candidatus Aminicenantes bacterium]|nr:alpha-amylase family glycosyl hydrolase [Candidatus Aminicenantes bacterium]
MSFFIRLTKLGDLLWPERPGPEREFHVSRACRSRFQFNQALFSLSSNVILADYQAVRIFAQKMNEKRDLARFPEQAIRAGSINAMGLIDEILHYVVSLYEAQARPQVFKMFMADLEKELGGSIVRKALLRFCTEFPPQVVYQEQVGVEEYLLGTSKGIFNREVVLEEMFMLWLENLNPAFSPFRELFDDSALAEEADYQRLMAAAKDFFSNMPPFGPDGQNLVDMLRSPALAYPESLSGQLRYISEKWGLLLGKYSDRLLSSLDLIKEDEKKHFPGPGPAAGFSSLTAGMGSVEGEEVERFSVDREWMPRLVLMAKTVYVWLDQLSKKYGRPLNTLEQIPDEELDMLASWGISGLWLIGIWERSPASRRIKQKCGNPEAMASAYSLYRYEIAADLGGEAALQNLKQRAWSRGIRLASDMVPNHMGIDSPWVSEHPEWFVSLDHSPFPAYSFNGEDISSDPRTAIYLEDHYYDRSDAAVVFKWVDRRSGAVRYIYHGNDGTRMPWNDTAQLNYLRPDVREAVMQTILAVARNFPIIRFDAAMTLTRRHYQRLWFPRPGSGGDIPSRSGLGMTQEHFDQALPAEFWREVVDRVAAEIPDTLLLAEAFWLMESYFVRSLGMHRVYNSAFMNFLKDEENAKFRTSLKDVLEVNPEILKRFVNFMNNPDEETALAQFGKDDKYFCACTLMAALPGLPMFGHGQIEGFAEKYGMEYRRAYLDERADDDLIRRHERQIFPLLRNRALFSGLSDFMLYDFYRNGGVVDENVIAFSNRHGSERCLVVVHNRFASTSGWVNMSAAFAGEDRPGGARSLWRKNLGQGLGLSDQPGWFVVFHDLVSGLEYIRSNSDLFAQGLAIELNAYQTHVFIDFKEMAEDSVGHLARLAAYLQGRGVASLEKAGREMALLPLHRALRELCQPELLARQLRVFQGRPGSKKEGELWQELENKIAVLMLQSAFQADDREGGRKTTETVIEDLLTLRTVFRPAGEDEKIPLAPAMVSGGYLRSVFMKKPRTSKLFVLWIYLRGLIAIGTGQAPDWKARFADWNLDGVAVDILRGWGFAEAESEAALKRIRIATVFEKPLPDREGFGDGSGKPATASIGAYLQIIFNDSEIQDLLQINRQQDDLFFNREAFSELCEWLTVIWLWDLYRDNGGERKDCGQEDMELLNFMNFMPALAAKAKYKLGIFLEKLDQLAAE